MFKLSQWRWRNHMIDLLIGWKVAFLDIAVKSVRKEIKKNLVLTRSNDNPSTIRLWWRDVSPLLAEALVYVPLRWDLWVEGLIDVTLRWDLWVEALNFMLLWWDLWVEGLIYVPLWWDLWVGLGLGQTQTREPCELKPSSMCYCGELVSWSPHLCAIVVRLGLGLGLGQTRTREPCELKPSSMCHCSETYELKLSSLLHWGVMCIMTSSYGDTWLHSTCWCGCNFASGASDLQ